MFGVITEEQPASSVHLDTSARGGLATSPPATSRRYSRGLGLGAHRAIREHPTEERIEGVTPTWLGIGLGVGVGLGVGLGVGVGVGVGVGLGLGLGFGLRLGFGFGFGFG